MDFLDIVMELRKRHGIEVPEADYQQLASLDSCAEYLTPKFNAGSRPKAERAGFPFRAGSDFPAFCLANTPG